MRRKRSWWRRACMWPNQRMIAESLVLCNVGFWEWACRVWPRVGLSVAARLHQMSSGQFNDWVNAGHVFDSTGQQQSLLLQSLYPEDQLQVVTWRQKEMLHTSQHVQCLQSDKLHLCKPATKQLLLLKPNCNEIKKSHTHILRLNSDICCSPAETVRVLIITSTTFLLLLNV